VYKDVDTETFDDWYDDDPFVSYGEGYQDDLEKKAGLGEEE